MPKAELRIYTKCRIHHYENCNTCAGFGVYSVENRLRELFPVIASEVHEKKFRGKVQVCPECKSTVLGLSNKKENKA